MALAPAEVGKRIAKARKAKGWTHEQFRDRVRETIAPKTNLRTIQRWQAGVNPKDGKSWLPRLGTLMELADLLEVPRSYFVEDEDVQVAMTDLHQQLGALVEEVAGLRDDLRGRDEHGESPASPQSRP